MNIFYTAIITMLAGTVSSAEFIFTEITEHSGLARQGGSFACAAADYDMDGYTDLAISTHGSVLIYHNNGNGTFSNITGNGIAKADTHGITWIDYNRDGWPDLFVCCGGNRGAGNGDANKIFINQSGRDFKQVELPEVLEHKDAGERCMLPADLVQNGGLDIILMSPLRPISKPITVRQDAGTWRLLDSKLDQFSAESITPIGVSTEGCPLFALQTSGANGGTILKFIDGAFEDVSQKIGVQPGYNVMRVIPFDYDNDGDLDLYYVCGRNWVSAPPEIADHSLYFSLTAAAPRAGNTVSFRAEDRLNFNLYINSMQGTSKLRLGSDAVLIERDETELDINDSRLEGCPKILGTEPGIYFWRDSGNICSFALVGAEATPFASVHGEITVDSGKITLINQGAPLKDCPNRLYENRNGIYVDVTKEAGLEDIRAGADAVAADFDNDGDIDLYVINGTDPYHNTPNVFFRNNGNRTFSNVTSECNMAGPKEGRGDSAIAFDIDNDGNLDIFILNGNGPAPVCNQGQQILLKNDTQTGNWGKIEVECPRGVLIKSTVNGRSLLQLADGMTGRFGYSIIPVHIGMGTALHADIEILRPSEEVTRHKLTAGTTLRIK